MKTLCLLNNPSDYLWLEQYLRSVSRGEEVIVFAPSLAGQVAARKLDLPFVSHQEIAWTIDKEELWDEARSKAHGWHMLPGISDDPSIAEVREFRGYPILSMHHVNLWLSLWEILQSYVFMERVLETETPDKIVIGARRNPIDINWLYLTAQSNGMEAEVAKILSTSLGIKLQILSPPGLRKMGRGMASGIVHLAKMPIRFALQALRRRKVISRFYHHQIPETPKTQLLVFAWGDYYMDQLLPSLCICAKRGLNVGVILTGGVLSNTQCDKLKDSGIWVVPRTNYDAVVGNSDITLWKQKVLFAQKTVAGSKILSDYFSNSTGSYFAQLAEKAINKELTDSVTTVMSLIVTEKIIDEVMPEAFFAHFSWMAMECVDVLPVRKRAIPTLGSSHGIANSQSARGETPATQWYAVPGSSHASALVDARMFSSDRVFAVGESRLTDLKRTMTLSQAKIRFGLDPRRPVVIICDNSGWTQTLEKRHSTPQTLQHALHLRREIPGLQLIYRIHHGADLNVFEEYASVHGVHDVVFQMGLSPLFVDIAQAADLVITHASSAIAESLVLGVRVIYLCALASFDSFYADCDAIIVVKDFNSLSQTVKYHLANQAAPEIVLEEAKSYLNRQVFGNRGTPAEALADLMVKMTTGELGRAEAGFDDWLRRIEISSSTKMSPLTTTDC